MGLKPRGDTTDGDRRYHEHAPTRAEHRNAEGLTGGVDRNTAFSGPPQAHIKLDASVDLATAHRLPGSPADGDQSEGSRRGAALGAHGNNERTGRGYGRSHGDGRKIGPLDLE